MKTTPFHPPKYLPEVLQAVLELGESGGLDSSRIVNYVRSTVDNYYPQLRNLSTQVRRALKYALDSEILKQRAGRYRINREIEDPYKECAECRRKKRQRTKGTKRTRRRSKRKAHFAAEEDEEVPVTEMRKRRRRATKSRKRTRRSRRRSRKSLTESPEKENNQNENVNEEMGEQGQELPEDIVYPDDIQNPEDLSHHNDIHCDNPDCLCNVKEEIEEISNFDGPT